MEQPKEQNEKPDTPQHIPFWRVVVSVIQAGFGVQHPSNRERDFKHGKLMPFLVAALLFVSIFVLILLAVVKMVLSS